MKPVVVELEINPKELVGANIITGEEIEYSEKTAK